MRNDTENFVLSFFRVGEGNEFLEEKLWRQKRFYKSKKNLPELAPPVVFVSFANPNQIKHYHPRSKPRHLLGSRLGNASRFSQLSTISPKFVCDFFNRQIHNIFLKLKRTSVRIGVRKIEHMY